jgi:N-acetylmuramoyl-L-alanine amidase
MRYLAGLLLLCLGLLAAAPAEARPLQLEVRSADGVALGHLPGYRDDRATYVALTDVARLVRGTLRSTDRGERLALVARGKVLEVRRDSPQVLVVGHLVELSAPVRVLQGSWRAPGDILIRALPLVLGSDVQVAEGSGAPPPPPVPRTVSALSLPPRAPTAAPSLAVAPAVAPPPARPAPLVEAPSAPAAAEPGRPAAPIKAGGVELRYRSYPAYTRIVLEGGAQFEPRLVESPGALVVPLAGLHVPPPRAARAVRDGLVAGLELGEVRGSAALRVSFERPPASRKVYRLKDPPRLVLDFYRGAPATPAALPAARPAALQTIVLDPGHGGHDSGAIGPGGLQEKDLTLDVGRRLAAILQEDLGVKVVLTRSRDQFVPLQERTAIANRNKADLFVSIHVNAARAGGATGTETYFLSSEATDNAARAAAAFENKVIELEAGPRGGSRDLLRSILWDLAQSEFQQESSRLAENLQDSLERALRQPSRGVKQAPFYVLGGAAMPAVLVEIGFITNPKEEERLQDEGFRDRIARALAAGVAAYKKRYDQKGGVVASP